MNRDPVLHYYNFKAEDEFWEQTTSFKSGLSELSHTIAVDEGRKLLFAADEYKSYGYNLSQRRLDERRR